MNKSLTVNRISPSKRYFDFINNNNGHYIKNDLDINKNNVELYYTSLSEDEKKKVSILDLNIYYYFINDMYKKYVSSKNRILQIIDTSIALNNRHNAFENKLK